MTINVNRYLSLSLSLPIYLCIYITALVIWRCSPWHYAQCCALKSKLWTYFTSLTFVIYAVCYLHLLVHLETLSLTFCAGLLLLLLLLLGVRLLALPVHRRGAHYCSRVRDGGGVWRCGVRHLVGGLRFQWGTPKMSHLGEKCWLSAGERPGDREGGREGDSVQGCRSSCAKLHTVKRNSTGN